MNTELLEFLIKNFTREGETILDPMCGSGSTGVVAALHGRNAIQIDIERRFVDWAEEARRRVEAHASLTPKGWIRNICGDARRLSELLKEADAVITSPPYTNQAAENPNVCRYRKGGRFAEEKLDAIITSPPYSDSNLGGGDERKRMERLVKAGYDPREFLGGRARNAVLRHYDEVDAVITSPPYADCKKAGKVKPEEVEKYAKWWEENVEKRKWNSWGKSFHTPGRLRGIQSLRDGYSNSRENIGNLPLGEIDAIITSPPYEGSLEGASRCTRGGIASRGEEYEELDETIRRLREFGRTDPKAGGPYGRSLAHRYSPNPDNIGNLKSSDEEYQALAEGLTRSGKPTYLSEMLKVYGEMFKVLKPGGLAIVVVKPFIRNRRVIDLPWYTWLLMRKVGFELERLYKLRLKQQSFWRILYEKKNPEVPRISHEYVIVARKRVKDSV